MAVNLTPDSIDRTFFFEHYNDGDGRKILITDVLTAYFIDAVGTILIFESTVPRNTQGSAADIFGGFLVNLKDSLTLVEE